MGTVISGVENSESHVAPLKILNELETLIELRSHIEPIRVSGKQRDPWTFRYHEYA